MAGQLNWVLNIYPWLRPALGGLYVKTARKSEMCWKIKINKTVHWELTWFIECVKWSSRLFFFKSMVWCDSDMGHSTLTIHVDASAQGFGIWFVSERLGYQCQLPVWPSTDVIFSFEALTVCSAIHLAGQFVGVTWLLVATDNTNTFDIFASLNAGPVCNPILISAVNVILQWDIDLWVVYIPEALNHVTDTLSQYHNDLVNLLVLGIQIESFTPPQDVMGAVKKWFRWLKCLDNHGGSLGHWINSIISGQSFSVYQLILPLLWHILQPQTHTLHSAKFTSCQSNQWPAHYAITSCINLIPSAQHPLICTYPESLTN